MPDLLGADLSPLWPTHSASAATGTHAHTRAHRTCGSYSNACLTGAEQDSLTVLSNHSVFGQLTMVRLHQHGPSQRLTATSCVPSPYRYSSACVSAPAEHGQSATGECRRRPGWGQRVLRQSLGCPAPAAQAAGAHALKGGGGEAVQRSLGRCRERAHGWCSGRRVVAGVVSRFSQ